MKKKSYSFVRVGEVGITNHESALRKDATKPQYECL